MLKGISTWLIISVLGKRAPAIFYTSEDVIFGRNYVVADELESRQITEIILNGNATYNENRKSFSRD